MGTDRDWSKWGDTEPYYAVLSENRYRAGKLDAAARLEFFRSGEEHVDRIVSTIRSTFNPAFVPDRVLDFGCGVGRLVLPFARIAGRVTGMDVSAAMLAEAEANRRHVGVDNVQWLQAGDPSGLRDGFDLVHSYIVLQHVPWKRGRPLVRSLAERVLPGGYLAVQVLAACRASWTKRTLATTCYHLPPARWLRNTLRGRPVFEPAMQMHVYVLDAIFCDLKALGYDTPSVTPVDNVVDFDSVLLIARRGATTLPNPSSTRGAS